MTGSNYNGESSVTEPSVTAQNPIFHSHSEIEETYQEPQTDESYECELCEYGENHVHHYAKFGQNGNKMHLKNETYDYVTKGGRQLPIKAQIHHHLNNNSNHKQLSNNSIKSDECEFCESGEKHVHHHAKDGQNGNMPHLKEERYDYAINEGMRLPLKARIHYHSTNNNQKVSSGSIESDECELCESGEKHVHHYAKVEQNKSKPPLKKETFDYATNEEMHLPSGGQIHQHSNNDYRKVSNNSTETGQEVFSYKEEEADVKCLVYQNQAAGESHGTHFYHVLAGP